MKTFDLQDNEYIELNKLMKILRLVNSGGEAHSFIQEGEVIVNGEVEYRKRKKLKKGDQIAFLDHQVEII